MSQPDPHGGKNPPSKPLDEEKQRERREPGLNTDGTGDTGADPASTPDTGNSNT